MVARFWPGTPTTNTQFIVPAFSRWSNGPSNGSERPAGTMSTLLVPARSGADHTDKTGDDGPRGPAGRVRPKPVQSASASS